MSRSPVYFEARRFDRPSPGNVAAARRYVAAGHVAGTASGSARPANTRTRRAGRTPLAGAASAAARAAGTVGAVAAASHAHRRRSEDQRAEEPKTFVSHDEPSAAHSARTL